MYTNLFLFSILFISAPLWAYQAPSTATYTEETSFYSAQNELLHTLVYHYNYQDQLLRRESYNAEQFLTGFTTFQYDAEGRLIRENAHNAEGSLSQYQLLTYAAEGKKEVALYDAQQRLLETRYFSYQNGRLHKERLVDAHEALLSTLIHHYDASGKKSRMVLFDAIGKLYKYTEYFYNSQGQCSEELHYSSSEQLRFRIQFYYDDYGQCTQQREYSATGQLIQYTQRAYQYHSYSVAD